MESGRATKRQRTDEYESDENSNAENDSGSEISSNSADSETESILEANEAAQRPKKSEYTSTAAFTERLTRLFRTKKASALADCFWLFPLRSVIRS